MNDKKTCNRVVGYLKPKNENLFKGFVEVNEVTNSQAINIIMHDFFQRIPPQERQELLSKGKSKNIF